MRSFEGSFRNLKFSPTTSILLNFFFPFIGIKCFFSSLKLQYRRTIVLLNKLKLFKETSFSKLSDDGHAISRQEKRRLPKSTARFPAKKRWHSPLPVGLPWDFPPPPPESVRTDGRTLTSQPKFFASIHYQEGVMNLGLAQAPVLANEKPRCLAIVTSHINLPRKFKGS